MFRKSDVTMSAAPFPPHLSAMAISYFPAVMNRALAETPSKGGALNILV